MMVTHSREQAIAVGNRLIMMQRGEIIHEVQGAEKRHIPVRTWLICSRNDTSLMMNYCWAASWRR